MVFGQWPIFIVILQHPTFFVGLASLTSVNFHGPVESFNVHLLLSLGTIFLKEAHSVAQFSIS